MTSSILTPTAEYASNQLWRRIPTVALVLCCSSIVSLGADEPVPGPCFGEGVKVGEVTADSAIIWTRLCRDDQCDVDFRLPGTDGTVRVVYQASGEKPTSTTWQEVDADRDFTQQFQLSELTPATSYHYTIEAQNPAGKAALAGSFRTAPAPTTASDVLFVVTTGHKYATIDDPGQGARIYHAMLELDPDFFVHTGDVVYYDMDTPPLAKNIELARLHWHRLYNLPRPRKFHRHVASYFMKDDHDLLKNDCWPGQTFGDLTFDEGVELFREQTPTGPLPYRTVQWGKDLQVWLIEGREYRSSNTMPDGPEKTIWGDKQWRWFQESFSDSNATFKVVVTPTPIVGPDRSDGSKQDNLANHAFRREGERVRQFLAAEPNTFVVCGDRHWQYASVDGPTGLHEYSTGPSTDAHAGGWKQDNRLPEHRFLRVAGGFLSVSVQADGPEIVFRHRDVDGRVVSEQSHGQAN